MAVTRKASHAQMQAGKWRPVDDLKLIEACKQTNDIREVYLSRRFSCKVGQQDIEQRWRILLYHPRVSKLAQQKISEWTVGSMSDTQKQADIDIPFSIEEERLLVNKCGLEPDAQDSNEPSVRANRKRKLVESTFATYRDDFAAGRTVQSVAGHYDELLKTDLVDLLDQTQNEASSTARSLDAQTATDVTAAEQSHDDNTARFLDSVRVASETIRREVEAFQQACAELDRLYTAKQLEEFDARYFPQSALLRSVFDESSVGDTVPILSGAQKVVEAEKQPEGDSSSRVDVVRMIAEQEFARQTRAECATIARLERELDTLRRLLRAESESETAKDSGLLANTGRPSLLATLDERIAALLQIDFSKVVGDRDGVSAAESLAFSVCTSGEVSLNYAVLVLLPPVCNANEPLERVDRTKRVAFVIRKPCVVIGRRTAECSADDEVDFDVSPYVVGRRVSRRHAEVTFSEADRRFSLLNRGTRPVFVNGTVTCTDERRLLPNGSVIELCDMLFYFRINPQCL